MIWEDDLKFAKVVILPDGSQGIIVSGVVVGIKCHDFEAAEKIARALRGPREAGCASSASVGEAMQ